MKCTKCLADNQDTAKYCSECGSKLSDLDNMPSMNVTKLQAYTPRYLAEKILLSRSALEGERKQVTVLFADMKGSMEMLAGRDPEEARKILDPVLEIMMETVHHYEGTVNQVMGDGIMALFGAPLAHEDHAIRACYAALRMQESIHKYKEEPLGMDVQIRVGLHSGDVVVRSIGNDLHMDYTAVGQTTHLAARMEQLAMPGSIRITADTFRLAEGFIEATSLGPIQIKGLAESVEVYEVTGARSVKTRLQASSVKDLSRFVGRGEEMDQLQQAFDQAAIGRGQVVSIVGEPGIGKSRLIYEFVHSRRTREWLVLESGSFSYGKATVYLPVIGLLKAYFNIHNNDDHHEIRERVIRKLLSLDPALEPTRTAFLALFDVPDEGSSWQSYDPLRRRQQTLDAVKALLIRESKRQPILLVFEDLQWIDGETHILLDQLVESIPASQILLIVDYRPEYKNGWGKEDYYRQLRLDTLTQKSSDELLNILMGEDPALESLKRHLIEQTEGNPLFLEESVRMLVETKVLEGERGSYRLVGESNAVHVPAKVQSIMAARIDRLSPDEKRLLQSAAVIGKDVPFALLNEITEDHHEAVRHLLAHLQAAEFVYETALFPELEYTFKHALTHEVAYGSLLQGRRIALHGAIVEAIERLNPNRMTEQIERLAHHAFRGELWRKATQYLQKAGRKSELRSANREAVIYFEQALVALKNCPVDHSSIGKTIDLHLQLAAVLFPLAELKKGFFHIQESVKLARSLGDQQRLVLTLISLGRHFWDVGEINQSVDACEQAWRIAAPMDDFDLQTFVKFHLSQAYEARGDYKSAIDHARWNVTAFEGKLKHLHLSPRRSFLAVLSLSWLSFSLAETGAFKEGLHHAEQGLRIAKTSNDLTSLPQAYNTLGLILFWKGDFSEAIEFLEKCTAICNKVDLPFMQVFNTAQLGRAYVFTGHPIEGLEMIKKALAQSADLGMMFCHTLSSYYLAEAYLLVGQISEALEFAEHTLNLARQHGTRRFEAWSLHLLGEGAAHPRNLNTGKAEEYYHHAITLAEELGMHPLIARCHLGLGKLYARTQDKARATEHLTMSGNMFREMEMNSWLRKAEELMQVIDD